MQTTVSTGLDISAIFHWSLDEKKLSFCSIFFNCRPGLYPRTIGFLYSPSSPMICPKDKLSMQGMNRYFPLCRFLYPSSSRSGFLSYHSFSPYQTFHLPAFPAFDTFWRLCSSPAIAQPFIDFRFVQEKHLMKTAAMLRFKWRRIALKLKSLPISSFDFAPTLRRSCVHLLEIVFYFSVLIVNNLPVMIC